MSSQYQRRRYPPHSVSIKSWLPLEELFDLYRQQHLELNPSEEEQISVAIVAKRAEVEERIKPITDEFNFPDSDRLIVGIYSAYTAPGVLDARKLLRRNSHEAVKVLTKCSKDLKSLIPRLGIVVSINSPAQLYNSEHDFLDVLATKADELDAINNHLLSLFPIEKKMGKKTDYWLFVDRLADLWEEEIKTKPRCSYSDYANESASRCVGDFYRFVVACTNLDRKHLGASISTGSTIKNILKERSSRNSKQVS